MKKLLFLLIFANLFSLNAEKFILKTFNQNSSDFVVKRTANENGFYSDGTHKDTGTVYNPEGYDQEGFDSEGLSASNCFYDANTDHIKVDGRYPLKVHYQGIAISNHTYVSTVRGYETDLYVFTKGNLEWSTSYWNQKKYQVCVQHKKQK